jgi:hypothetical protein
LTILLLDKVILQYSTLSQGTFYLNKGRISLKT